MRGNVDPENLDTFRRIVQDCDTQDAELRMPGYHFISKHQPPSHLG